MNTDRDIQISFLKWVKEKANDSQSFVDDLGALLDLSRDSAYRRMRGETLLTFNEIRKISLHYGASLDAFFNLSSDTVLFKKRTVNENYTYPSFLESVLQSINLIDPDKDHKMIFIAKDIPPFHYFQFPHLNRFKSFFWQRTIFRSPEFQHASYDKIPDPGVQQLSKKVWDAYRSIPSLEIWSDETMNISLHQIEYYFESGILPQNHAREVVKELALLVQHLKKEAEQGLKLDYDEKGTRCGSFELYYNEVEIGDNTVFFSMGERKMVLKTYNLLNLLTTTDVQFCDSIEKYIHNMLHKSVPISTSSEKERIKFFSKIEYRVQQLSEKIG